ncbi:MAG TPA: hypothetical protein VM935_05540 [Chitinophagaceae bacterium]|nr:hypothetical protein [Chitinophagaceae bacterium]
MAKKVIVITGSNRTTGTLTLSDGGKTSVYNKDEDENRKIVWEVHDAQQEEVKSFFIEGKSGSPNHPFDTAVSRKHETKVSLKVKKDAAPVEWGYNIIWRDKFNVDHTYDPKISVIPTPLQSETDSES